MKRFLALLAVAALPALSQAQVPAQPQTPIEPASIYTKQEAMIPMRDGVRLYTEIYVPRDSSQKHPIMLMRTPYSSGPYGPDRFPGFFRGLGGGQLLAYMRQRYIFVFQDVRGRFMSEGTFENVRPYIEHKRSKQDIDESSDTYDTVDWLIHNVRTNNGRVGVRGTSYPGFYSSMAAIDAHPAVKAVSPQAPVTEWMGGDDFIHNGALLLPHAFDFYASFGWPRAQPTQFDFRQFNHGTPDGYDFFLHRLGALSNANPRFFHDSIAFWDSLAAHPSWDSFWEARSARRHLRNLKPAMLWVGGWFDTENLWGALHAYAAAEQQSPKAVNRLVMGPWSHGQWNRDRADSLGAVPWGSNTARFFSDSIEVPFMNYYLLGDGQPPLRSYEAAVFETGPNVWHFVDAWPPKNTTPRSLYLRENGVLSFDKPAGAGNLFDEYTSDPNHPVPYTAAFRHWYDPGFMVEDQRFAGTRPDVLVYETEPLTASTTVAGPIDVDFVVSTSGTDSDWIVKVIDVFPDTARQGGYQMLVRGDVLRGKFRNSMSKPEPFVPNQPTPIHFQMSDIYHTFQPGHRIMVQVQSTWFPMIDRNPGKFIDIWKAMDSDFVSTTQRVFRSADHASRVTIPVLPSNSAAQ